MFPAPFFHKHDAYWGLALEIVCHLRMFCLVKTQMHNSVGHCCIVAAIVMCDSITCISCPFIPIGISASFLAALFPETDLGMQGKHLNWHAIASCQITRASRVSKYAIGSVSDGLQRSCDQWGWQACRFPEHLFQWKAFEHWSGWCRLQWMVKRQRRCLSELVDTSWPQEYELCLSALVAISRNNLYERRGGVLHAHLWKESGEAIERNRHKYDDDYFAEYNYTHFRWAHDLNVYHYDEFPEFYGDDHLIAWDAAPCVMMHDGSFFVPHFLLQILLPGPRRV